MAEFVDPRAVEFLRRAAREDDVLRRIREAVVAGGLPSITPEAGRTLQTLMRIAAAKRVVEVGTCLGYSAVWIGRGLAPGGRLETLEFDARRADQAERFLAQARLVTRVHVVRGDAHALLRKMPARSRDAVFIDADKEGMPDYFDQSMRILRSGGLLLADNVFWQGSTFRGSPPISGTREVLAFVDAATNHPNLDATILPLGDGLLVARKR